MKSSALPSAPRQVSPAVFGRPIHVLHVLGSLDRGGAEVRTIELLRQMDRRRVRFSFLTLGGRPGAMAEDACALGAETHPLKPGLGFAPKLRRLVDGEGIDVVQSHVHYSSGYVLRHAARAGVQGRIALFHSTGDGRPDTFRRRMQRRIMKKWISRHATAIAAVSRAVMEAAWSREWAQDPRCRVFYNGHSVSAFSGPASRDAVRAEFGVTRDAPLFIHVGSLHAVKNHQHLISVFAEIARRSGDARLLLVGRDAGAGSQVRRQIRDLGLDERVVVAGERSDVPRLLKAADVMLFPSVREGLPGAVVEACAAGVPVVGSDIAPIREVADHFRDVECLSLNAPVSAWADAAETAARRHQQSGSLEKSLRHFAQTPFDMERAADGYLGILETSMGEVAAPRRVQPQS